MHNNACFNFYSKFCWVRKTGNENIKISRWNTKHLTHHPTNQAVKGQLHLGLQSFPDDGSGLSTVIQVLVLHDIDMKCTE